MVLISGSSETNLFLSKQFDTEKNRKIFQIYQNTVIPCEWNPVHPEQQKHVHLINDSPLQTHSSPATSKIINEKKKKTNAENKLQYSNHLSPEEKKNNTASQTDRNQLSPPAWPRSSQLFRASWAFTESPKMKGRRWKKSKRGEGTQKKITRERGREGAALHATRAEHRWSHLNRYIVPVHPIDGRLFPPTITTISE